MQSGSERSLLMPPPRPAFSRSSRLLKHSSFEAVYKQGRRHFSSSMTFFYILRPAADVAGKKAAQIGFTVGRVLGGSVERNRIKRRVRDAVRLNLTRLNEALSERELAAEIVINPKKSALKAVASALRLEVERGFEVIAANKQPRDKQK